MIHYRPTSGAQLLILNETEDAYYRSCGGTPEHALIEWVREFIPKDKTFVDVGAHCGTWSLNLATSVPRVEAFEAQLRTFYQLCGGIFLNDLHEKVFPHHLALCERDPSDPNETKELKIISSDGGGSSIVSHGNPSYDIPIRAERTPFATLDSFCLAGVGFIKIDTEGAEEHVLRGGIETLEGNGWPTILLESWLPEWRGEWARPIRESLFAYLTELGYRIVPVTGYAEQFIAEKS